MIDSIASLMITAQAPKQLLRCDVGAMTRQLQRLDLRANSISIEQCADRGNIALVRLRIVRGGRTEVRYASFYALPGAPNSRYWDWGAVGDYENIVQNLPEWVARYFRRVMPPTQ